MSIQTHINATLTIDITRLAADHGAVDCAKRAGA